MRSQTLSVAQESDVRHVESESGPNVESVCHDEGLERSTDQLIPGRIRAVKQLFVHGNRDVLSEDSIEQLLPPSASRTLEQAVGKPRDLGRDSLRLIRTQSPHRNSDRLASDHQPALHPAWIRHQWH